MNRVAPTLIVILLFLLLVQVSWLGADYRHLADTIADSLPGGVTQALLHTFKICGTCQTFKRLGDVDDGGYLMCMDGLNRDRIKGVYSFGVDNHDQWSVDMYNLLGVPVNQFDCTVEKSLQECPKCHFHQICVQASTGAGAFKGKKNWAIDQVLNETGFRNALDRSLVLKIDVEGSEWPILAEMHPLGRHGPLLRKFQQVVVEFHDLSQRSKHGQYLEAMYNLLRAGFRVAHLHGNNNGGTYYVGSYSIPDALEVTLVSEGPPLAQCHDPTTLSLDANNRLNWNLEFEPHLP